ncbi:P-loop NTPase [Candidatus Peregrinibacteria bacterium]|nr:P-loop NTPase [Candidatus Peregrinibacteria bacterium]
MISQFNQNQIKIPGIKRIIGVISGKGGVGKTFIASGLALTLAKLGSKTGLLDADISCPNVFKILGLKAKTIPTPDSKLIPVEKYGIKIISMAGLCNEEDEPIVWRGPIMSKIIQQLLKETVWRELDTLVIDFATGASDSVITILQNFAIDGVIVATTPQKLSLLDAKRTLNMTAILKIPVLGIVENMRGEMFGEGGASILAEEYRLPILGSIPMRKQISALCDTGVPPVFHMNELEIIFNKMARFLMKKTEMKS